MHQSTKTKTKQNQPIGHSINASNPTAPHTQILHLLLRHELSGAFCEEIDPALLPDYPRLVRRPLDLQTIWYVRL